MNTRSNPIAMAIRTAGSARFRSVQQVPGQFLGYRDFVAFVTQPQADDLGKIFGMRVFFACATRMYYVIPTRMKRKSMPQTPGQQEAFLDEVAGLWPLAKGSVSEVRKPCVRKGCKACAEGRGHPAAIYTYREGGKLRCMHVRPEFVPELKQAIENGRALEAALVRLGREAVLRSRGREP